MSYSRDRKHRSGSRSPIRVRKRSRTPDRSLKKSKYHAKQDRSYSSSDERDSRERRNREKETESRSYGSPRTDRPKSHKSKEKERKKSLSPPPKKHKHKKKKKTQEKSKRVETSSSDSSSESDSSSASSVSSNDSTKLMLRLEKERLRVQEDKRRRKEAAKLVETAEEKRLRRLMKKEAKERKRKERMGWDTEYLHYTNADNPFGDANLLSTFVWKKKMEKEGLGDAPSTEVEARNRMKQEENRKELEKVKKRRLERELERQKREEEMALLQRQKEAAQFQEWERQEDVFHLEQARLRSKIRIQDGRAKPIDLLAKYISAEEDVDAVEMHEPYTYLNGLTVKDLEDLLEDIKVYKELDRGRNLAYWSDITTIVEDELNKLHKLEQSEYEAAVGRREGIHQSVAPDVASVFRGKTAAQLDALKQQIETKILGKPEGVDIGYWESLLSQLKAHMARARLRDRHQDNLRRKLELLKAEQGVVVAQSSENEEDESAESGEEGVEVNEVKTEEVEVDKVDEEKNEEEENEKSNDGQEGEEDKDGESSSAVDAGSELLSESFAEYETGGYSPKYVDATQVEPGTLVTAEEEDWQRLEFIRRQVQGTGARVENVMTAEEQLLQREARKGMGGDEAEFSVESAIENHMYLWSDKYRPRKPRYFNRVHTGFEWNKYNQTHYDMDNPPPKIVQGYKFNIFYPDLIDKSTTPEYYLLPCEDNKDFAILRFHAGPPYEDIAFKIVNREWEYSYKRGFRCQFHNNIFQLWFHFKRYRYRR